MATTEFVNGSTLSDADWFNDVDRVVYDILGDPADDAAARTNLGLAIGADVQAYDADTTKNDTANSFTAIQKWAKGADVASAGALTLGTDGNYFDITGITSITSIGTLGVGTVVKLHFDGALTLTHHATDLVLPTGANITTAAGDEFEFTEYASGDWRCTGYVRASGAALLASGITLGTAVASTSGVSIDFTGIPAGVKRVTVMFDEVSTSGTSPIVIAIGDSGGFETTGYSGGAVNQGPAYVANTVGFLINPSNAAASTQRGIAVLQLFDGTTWSFAANVQAGSANLAVGTGVKTLSATLDRVRITTAGGADTFDAGSINISYE